jgi:hypothetical protein
MRLRVLYEDESGRPIAESYIDHAERLTSREFTDASQALLLRAMRWMAEYRQEAERRFNQSSSLPPDVFPKYTPAATVHGRQPPTVANVDRSTSAESKEAQS